MKKINKILLGCSLLLLITTVKATLLVEQFDDFWSQDVNDLKNYANTNTASTSAFWNIIDFTDDPAGFVGAIPGSNPWPSAASVGATGTSHPLNDTFFVKITGDFGVTTDDTYTFRTFNDDGVFLYIDGLLTINDPNQHPEQQFTGTQFLTTGNHSIELYFFENLGEASLEFSVADSSGQFTHLDASQFQTIEVPEPIILTLISISLIGFSRKKCNKMIN